MRPSRAMVSVLLPLATVLAACAAPDAQVERASYLTLMGDDTLAVEWVEFDGGAVEAQALIRGERTTYGDYHLAFGEDGEVVAYSADTYLGGGPDGQLLRSEELVTEDDGTRVMVVRQDGEERRAAFEAEPGAVPFIDMLHWPFEAALRQQARQGGEFGDITTFTGRGMEFAVEPNADGSFAIVHPSRGPSTVQIDPEGRIRALDGTGSTRAYQLSRHEGDAMDPAAMGERFADRPLGELSGRGQIDDRVAGVSFTGDFGTPQRRGRDIFGGLLAYGDWWRTGANAATQFSFDRDIVVDGETIPAGDYSLSSIPEEDGGTLIINRRTGQGGQSYNESEDQARVEMRRSMLDEPVEVFDIRVVPSAEPGEDGRIELRWDDTVYWVPFTVAG